ncbi:MAG: uncharacterized protein A8A55_3260, partial [Amphiamblys sp. WSBS2006]
IVCHGEAAPEDLVSPLCREMHFVICEECVEDLQERTNKGYGTDEEIYGTGAREVFCPYCKEKQDDKTFQEEILGSVLSLMSPQTLPGLEITPDMAVETATRLTREAKVVLSNIAVTDTLFFKLMSRAVVEIRNKISIVRYDDALDWCIGELDWRTYEPIIICFDGYTAEEMKQIHENIKAMPSKNIQINAKEIYAEGDSVYFLLKAWTGAGECNQDLFLITPKKKHIEEFLEEEDSSLWIGKVKTLDLRWYAVGMFPKLMLHKENEMEELRLIANYPEHLAEILKEKNSSICVGKVKTLNLIWYAVGMLPKLMLHKENEMEELRLIANYPAHITGMLKEKNSSICVGKVKTLNLEGYAIGILPKLKLHDGN